MAERFVQLNAGGALLAGDLMVPERAQGLVLFAHGSGSSRRGPRNRFVAGALQAAGLATLHLDLLTEDEGAEDALTAHLRFDIELLALRLIGAMEWASRFPASRHLELGLFGADSGAAAAFVAAAERPALVRAVVSRGGRPELAAPYLGRVVAPTLLLVGGFDSTVLEQNEYALELLRGPASLELIPGASHLFEEPGALEQVASRAAGWFSRYLVRQEAEARW